MGNLNQGQGTNYSYYIGPNGIIIDQRLYTPPQPAEEPQTVEEPIPVEKIEIIEEPVKPVENPQCAMCKKKLGPGNQFKCRCENIYCTQHMHSFNHKCTFDYRTFHKEQLMKENPTIGKKSHKFQEI